MLDVNPIFPPSLQMDQSERFAVIASGFVKLENLEINKRCPLSPHWETQHEWRNNGLIDYMRDADKHVYVFIPVDPFSHYDILRLNNRTLFCNLIIQGSKWFQCPY